VVVGPDLLLPSNRLPWWKEEYATSPPRRTLFPTNLRPAGSNPHMSDVMDARPLAWARPPKPNRCTAIMPWFSRCKPSSAILDVDVVLGVRSTSHQTVAPQENRVCRCDPRTAAEPRLPGRYHNSASRCKPSSAELQARECSTRCRFANARSNGHFGTLGEQPRSIEFLHGTPLVLPGAC